MNRIPSRGRLLKRIAAATAIAVSGALLATPSTASAQTTAGVDCAALSSPPTAAYLASALKTAAACEVEVPVEGRVSRFSTTYATPEGQLHVVATAAPVQASPDGVPEDPTLVVKNGTLTQSSAPAFMLRYTDMAKPLIAAGVASLNWSGATPEPSFTGTTAVYDEIVTGLDLAVDADSFSAELRFTAADAEAWTALASGLTASSASDIMELSALGGALHWDSTVNSAALRTTPFTVRDAAGNVSPVSLTLGAGGAVAFSLPDGALGAVQYPLDLSTQWGRSSYTIANWGSVTSAEPDLAIFGGEAGLDAPYFEAAGESGDALAGSYCDALADSGCAEVAEAESYWEFKWPYLQGVAGSSTESWVNLQPESARLTIDAAEGASCVAPDLDVTEGYSPGVTWNTRPAVLGDAGAGVCEDGTAVYDVSAPVVSAWQDPENYDEITFGMTVSAETARFDGDSARLDAYVDIIGFAFGFPQSCADQNTSTPAYGDFTATPMPPDSVDLKSTWTVTMTTRYGGNVRYVSEPRPVAAGLNPQQRVEADAALEDAWYSATYDFVSTDGGGTYSRTCHFYVDTSTPEIKDIRILDDGPYPAGSTVEVEVQISDPSLSLSRDLTVTCSSPTGACGNTTEVKASSGYFSTAVFDIDASKIGTLTFTATDSAGNRSASMSFALPMSHARNDYNGDGFQDLVTVRKADGKLLLHAGNGDGTFDAGVSLGSGWGGRDVVMAGDLTSDGRADLLVRDNKTGYLYTYPGNGSGGFNAPAKVGSGWGTMNGFTTGDFDEDGKIDLLGLRKSQGRVYFYPGRGDGTFGTRAVYDDVFYWADSITALGDVDYDGYEDLLARDRYTGGYTVYFGYEGLGTNGQTAIDPALLGGDGRKFSQVAAAGDLNGDGLVDIVGVDSRTGELVLRSWSETVDSLAAALTSATGWGGQRLPVAPPDLTYSFIGLMANDIIARRTSDGKLFDYRGNGAGGFFEYGPDVLGTGWNSMNLIERAGDFNGDGLSDLMARKTATGELWLYPGKGGLSFGTPVKIGTGWNGASAIVSGQDFNGDGKVDIIAREKSTGYLWLYPGKGDGKLGSRVQIGTGWNSLREIAAAGDLDHDGHADILAIRSSDNCMYFYGGRGGGALKPGVKMSCNWVGYDSVTAVGDFSGDGHADWVARRQSDGALYLYKGNGAGGYSSRAQIGTGWNSMNLIA